MTTASTSQYQPRDIHVLLVDPSPGECQLIGNLLAGINRDSYHLTCCDRRTSALPQMLSGDYDVILLDYFWRGVGCQDLLESARVQGCGIPILVMTDSLETDVDRRAISLGASDYLIKRDINSLLLERTIRYAMERKTTEVELARLAHFDPLTKIPNRILFRDRLEHAIALSQREHRDFALMFLDLNDFKQVNDQYGHDIGDALLCACAERLVSCLRSSDSVARVGGDEFTLLLEDSHSCGDLAHLADKIIAEISRPYTLRRMQVSISCSIGIAVYPAAGEDAEQLMSSADAAMYQSKKSGGRYAFFTDAMNIEARQRLQLEADLQGSLQRQEFELVYQPRVDLRSGDVVGVEALLRWQHPSRGQLPPAEFLSVADESGLIVELGYWVVRRVCLDLQKLKQRHISPVPVSINLSARQFGDPRLVERIAQILHETGIDGRELELEFTEADLIENMETYELCMLALSHLGLSFLLDDFGTSSSSFTQLQKLPIGALMVDRHFIAGMDSNSDTQLVAAMINLGHSLGKVMIAEGVETERQLQLLQEFGCDIAQGYYLNRPLGLSDYGELLLQRRGDVAMAGRLTRRTP